MAIETRPAKDSLLVPDAAQRIVLVPRSRELNACIRLTICIFSVKQNRRAAGSETALSRALTAGRLRSKPSSRPQVIFLLPVSLLSSAIRISI